MARSKASQSASAVSLVAEPIKSEHRKKTIKSPSPEVLGISGVIVLDSEDESEQPTFRPRANQFGASRVLDTAAFSMVDQKPRFSPSKGSESSKMKGSRKRVLAVEASGASLFDSKCFQASPSSMKRESLGLPSDRKYPHSDSRTTPPGLLVDESLVAPTIDPDTTQQSVKAKRKRKSGGIKQELEMRSCMPEHAEQDDKENNVSDVQGGNGVKNENSSKKRKKEAADSSVDPESSSKPSQSPLDLPAGVVVPGEGKILSTCHQCRQRHDISLAWCRDSSGKRACTQKFCAKCLRNRYGEIVAEVQERESWSCPRCRGICNCSMCMKKKGLAPTGGLAKRAKAAGYSSVADLLEKFPNMLEEKYTREESAPVTSDNPKVVPVKHDPVVQPVEESRALLASEAVKKSKQVKEATEATESARPGREPKEKVKKMRGSRSKSDLEVSVSQTHVDDAHGQSSVVEPERNVEAGEISTKKKKKQRKSRAKFRVGEDLVREHIILNAPLEAQEEEAVEEEIMLPTGTPLLKVADLDFPPEAIGPAFQIVEFCSAFEKPLKLRRGKGPKILSEMIRGGTLRKGGQSDLVQLHVLLLSIILDDVDDDTNVTMSAVSKNCWVYHLERHLSEQFSLLKKAAESHAGGEDEDGGSVPASASTSETIPLPVSLWPVSEEDMPVIVEALRSGVDGYGNLPFTTRVKLLAALCDDTLTTKKMRDYVDKTISNHEVEQKEHREELLAIKKQAREIHESHAKEVVAARRDNAYPLVRDLERVKREYAKLAEKEAQLTEATAKLCGPRCDALRTEPVAVHKSGSRFWRLKGAKDREVIVLQDISNLELDLPNETWSVFSEDQEQEVLDCITYLNTRKKATDKSTRGRRKRKGPVHVECKVPTTIESPQVPIIELSD